MARVKGIVLKTDENKVIVLDESGIFRTRPYKKPVAVGQKIAWVDYSEFLLYTVTGILLLSFCILVFYFFMLYGR